MPATFVKMAGKNSHMIRLESGQLHKCRQCTFDSDESQCTQGIDYHDWSLSFEYLQVQQAFGDNDLFTPSNGNSSVSLTCLLILTLFFMVFQITVFSWFFQITVFSWFFQITVFSWFFQITFFSWFFWSVLRSVFSFWNLLSEKI